MSTTHTATTTTPTSVTYVRYNGAYIHTVPGVLKIACLVLNLIGFICINLSQYSFHSRGTFFNTVAMTGFWFTGIMLLLYVFQVVYKFVRIPWLRIEMIFCIVWTFAYMLAASLAAALGSGAYIAAAFFGFLAMIAYGYDAFLKYRDLKNATIIVSQTVTVTVA